VRSGIAIVRQVRIVDEIWSDAWETTSRTSGQFVGPRFKMVELEFTPEGAREPVHVLDRIDVNSVPGLGAGSVVAIEYSDPEAVRIVGATRNYTRQLITYLLMFVYGTGALVTFIFVPLRRAIRQRARASTVLRILTDPEAALKRMTQASQWSQLPEDDPQRRALEAAINRLRSARSSGEKKK